MHATEQGKENYNAPAHKKYAPGDKPSSRTVDSYNYLFGIDDQRILDKLKREAGPVAAFALRDFCFAFDDREGNDWVFRWRAACGVSQAASADGSMRASGC